MNIARHCFNRRKVLGAGMTATGGLFVPALVRAETALPRDIAAQDVTTVTSFRTSTPQVALTFDDGPHPRLTPALLDILAARRIRATFYLIGNRVQRYPHLAARIAAEGHEIGNHSWSHPFLDRFNESRVISEIDRTNSAVFEATGLSPVTFRPPYGAFTQRQRRMLHDRRNMPSVLWSVDPQDWRRPGAHVVASRILHDTRPGAIILSHDIHPGTIRAMPETLEGLIARGFRFETISQVLGWPEWQSRHFTRRGT